MRVTGGQFRGHPLASPKGEDIRPTSDRVRQALFNVLGSIEGLSVLDLFAGAGTLGFEALSRGATRVVFVEPNPRSLSALAKSLEQLHLQEQVRVLRRYAPAVVQQLVEEGEHFDLVFLDPPYGSKALIPSLDALGAGTLVRPGGVVVAEHDRDHVLATSFGSLAFDEVRVYGRTHLSYYVQQDERHE